MSVTEKDAMLGMPIPNENLTPVMNSHVNRREAAQFLTDRGFPIAAATLAKKAVTGGGPPYQLWNGRATYDVEHLLAWAYDSLGPAIANTSQRR